MNSTISLSIILLLQLDHGHGSCLCLFPPIHKTKLHISQLIHSMTLSLFINVSLSYLSTKSKSKTITESCACIVDNSSTVVKMFKSLVSNTFNLKHSMDCRIQHHKMLKYVCYYFFKKKVRVLLSPVHLAEEDLCHFTIFCHYAISVCTAFTIQDKTKKVSE